MLVIVVALFALCWLPLQTYSLLSEIAPNINSYVALSYVTATNDDNVSMSFVTDINNAISSDERLAGRDFLSAYPLLLPIFVPITVFGEPFLLVGTK